jgi:hypothetical protein
MFIKISKIFLILLVNLLWVCSVFANAQTPDNRFRTIPNIYKPTLAPAVPDNSYDLSAITLILQFVAGNIIYFAGALAVLFLVWAGLLYAAAYGDDANFTKAKDTILNVFVGLLVMMLSLVIVRFVIEFFLALP